MGRPSLLLLLLLLLLLAPAPGVVRAGGALPLDGAVVDAERLDAARTARDVAGLDVGEDGLAVDLVAAPKAGGGAEGAVALDQLAPGQAGLDLEVVNVLGVVGEQLVALVQHGDELVGGCVAVRGGDDVLGDRVEDGRVLLEDVDVKDLLGVAEAQVLQLGIQTRALGTEVGDAERRGDAGARDDDDVAALGDEPHCVVYRVVRGQLDALGELPGDGERQQVEVGLVGLAVEESRRLDGKGREKLLGRVAPAIHGALAENGRALVPELPTKSAGLLGCTNV